MELKVFKDTVAAYGGRWETRLELPVETELLIPDYLPAVFKIVKCLVEPVLLQNHTAAAKWQGEGYLRCTVYYQSDEAGAQLYRIEQKFPFEKTADLPEGRYETGPAAVSGELEYVNCRAISEHRIDLRGAYALCVAVQMVDQLELVTSLADCGIEQRACVLNGRACAAVERRAADLHIDYVFQGVADKAAFLQGFFAEHGLTREEVAYCGDDLNDLAGMALCGFVAAPADATPAVAARADYRCPRRGGEEPRDVAPRIVGL